MKIVASIVGLVFLFVGGFIVSARLGLLEGDPVEARALYGAPPSQFLVIGGTRIHFRDEGAGPVLVLLHGSRGSLQQWDGWVRALGGRFRILRFDSLAHGLTGASAQGDYSAQQSMLLMNKLLAARHIDRFILVGTSSGATEAVRYAATFPLRVEKLLLSTVPLRLPPQSRSAGWDGAVFWIHDKLLGTTATNLYWRTFLRSVFGDAAKVTPELVQRYRVLNTLPGQQQSYRARIATWLHSGGAARDFAMAAQVTAPTFIQWGGAGPVLPRQMFCSISAAFTATAPRIIIYPALGHMLVLEDPVSTARDALAFIDGAAVGDSARDTCALAPTPALTAESRLAPAAARSAASLAASSR